MYVNTFSTKMVPLRKPLSELNFFPFSSVYRETGGDKRAREEGRHIYPCPQSILHGADQAATQSVSIILHFLTLSLDMLS